jgi:hypothetical protein
LKGFNYLVQDEADILYIADEVGLGKLMLLLGIASLLRHFSTQKEDNFIKMLSWFQKRNLQYKGLKKSIICNSYYLLECNIAPALYTGW